MATAANITLDHCISELKRTLQSRKEKYPGLVGTGKMTPYTRDFRIAVIERLLQVCTHAKQEKEQTVFIQLKNM